MISPVLSNLYLNEVDRMWSWLKFSRLCNFAPQDAIALDGRVVAELSAVRDNQKLLRSFWHASDLPLPRLLTLLPDLL